MAIQLQLPSPHYSLLTSERDGLPAVIVVNAALKDFEHREIFPWCLSVAIEARALADNSMPTQDEWEIFDTLGDRLEQGVLNTLTDSEATNALFLARVTWNGQRQLLYYAHDPKPVDQALRAAIDNGNSEREWEYYMEEDFAWQQAEPFLRMVAAAEPDA